MLPGTTRLLPGRLFVPGNAYNKLQGKFIDR
jgi:hypothetical protein